MIDALDDRELIELAARHYRAEHGADALRVDPGASQVRRGVRVRLVDDRGRSLALFSVTSRDGRLVFSPLDRNGA